jgi:glycosyltransferase involved in cell wall biosynthesis
MVPFFSVIIPTFNRCGYVGNAIESVLAQTFQDVEIIVVDDCSTDDTGEVLKGYAERDVRILSTSCNSGASAARNRGIEASRGRFVVFLDDDDTFVADALETIRRHHLASPDIQFSWAGICLEKQNAAGAVIETCDLVWSPPNGGTAGLKNLDFVLNIGTNFALCVQRGIFDEVGVFDTSLPRSEDRDLLLRIAMGGYTGKPIPKVLVHVCCHARGSLGRPASGRMTPAADEAVIAKHKGFMLQPENRQLLTSYYCLLFELHCENRNFWTAMKYLIDIAVRRPSRLPKYLEKLVRVFSGLESLKEKAGYRDWKNNRLIKKAAARQSQFVSR